MTRVSMLSIVLAASLLGVLMFTAGSATAAEPNLCVPGTKVRVLFQDNWYDASVVLKRDRKTRECTIGYEGYSPWTETVTDARLRPRPQSAEAPPVIGAPVDGPRAGQPFCTQGYKFDLIRNYAQHGAVALGRFPNQKTDFPCQIQIEGGESFWIHTPAGTLPYSDASRTRAARAQANATAALSQPPHVQAARAEYASAQRYGRPCDAGRYAIAGGPDLAVDYFTRCRTMEVTALFAAARALGPLSWDATALQKSEEARAIIQRTGQAQAQAEYEARRAQEAAIAAKKAPPEYTGAFRQPAYTGPSTAPSATGAPVRVQSETEIRRSQAQAACAGNSSRC